MRLNTTKYYSKLKKIYLDVPNYKIENDPTLTFEEFLIYQNLKNYDLSRKTFETNDFKNYFDIWMNEFVAHFFAPSIVERE